MGAGQIGGIATLLEIDFDNAAGFIGSPSQVSEAQFVVYFLSHAMIFCAGALIEPHIVLTPASCVFGENHRFRVFAGTHKFLLGFGAPRMVNNICIHRGYNHTRRWEECAPDNLALLVLNKQYSFHMREDLTEYVIDRVRYGSGRLDLTKHNRCYVYGWGSRRTNYLVPLMIELFRMEVFIMPKDQCYEMWNFKDKYLCVHQPKCRSEKFGALCPDDLGSVIVCDGFIYGMMTSRLIDRPCGVGYLDIVSYKKFLTCGVDDSRDVIEHDSAYLFDFAPSVTPLAPRQLKRKPFWETHMVTTDMVTE